MIAIRSSSPNRPWYQYSLRSLFVLTALLSIVFSLYALVVQRTEKQRRMGGYIDSLLYGESHTRLQSLRITGNGLDVTCEDKEALRYIESAMGNAKEIHWGGIVYRFEFFFEDGGSYSDYGYCWEDGIAIERPRGMPHEKTYVITFSEPRPEEIERICGILGIRSRYALKSISGSSSEGDNHE